MTTPPARAAASRAPTGRREDKQTEQSCYYSADVARPACARRAQFHANKADGGAGAAVRRVLMFGGPLWAGVG